MDVEIHFTTGRIVVPALVLPSQEIGACAEFHGIVRELEHAVPIGGLRYEAYEPMARQQLSRHFQELGALHSCALVLFIHRLGWVPVAEASLYIRVLAAHRGPAFRFLEGAVERLKADVPIWKCSEHH